MLIGMLFSFTFVSFQSAQLAGLDIMNIATGYLATPKSRDGASSSCRSLDNGRGSLDWHRGCKREHFHNDPHFWKGVYGPYGTGMGDFQIGENSHKHTYRHMRARARTHTHTPKGLPLTDRGMWESCQSLWIRRWFCRVLWFCLGFIYNWLVWVHLCVHASMYAHEYVCACTYVHS